MIGTDGIGADMFAEAQFAFFKGRDARTDLGAGEWIKTLANNQRLASETFAVALATLDGGSAADLIVLDYNAPTPITGENLAWHFAFGISSAAVESVMVNGRFVIKDRKSILDENSFCKLSFSVVNDDEV